MNEFYVLNDGIKIPKIGYGTYNEAFEDNKRSILRAIECGYRFFDTASLYETERSLGCALKESGISRKEVIIETKLWIDEMDMREPGRLLRGHWNGFRQIISIFI